MVSLDPVRITAVVKSQHQRRPFSGVVQVRAADRIVFAEAFGQANRAAGVANTVETRFATASGTKTFTAMAICRLIEAGRLSLDTALTDVIDTSLPHFDPGITIEHLLTHTSGAADYFDEEELNAQADFSAAFGDVPLYRVRRPADILPLFANEPMKFAPGERFSYNNGGFVLLGRIIELISGAEYADFVEMEVFERAGMADAGFFEQDRLPERTALGYLPDGRSNIYDLTAKGMPDGGAYVTAADMAAFWDALLGDRLVGEEMRSRMLHPHVSVGAEGDDGTHYGYGMWMMLRRRATSYFSCSGADPGVAFASAHFPQQGIEITVLGNTDAEAWPMFGALRALVLDGDLGLTV